MPAKTCIVCGRGPLLHVTDRYAGLPVKQYHYCDAHAPKAVQVLLQQLAEQAQMVHGRDPGAAFESEIIDELARVLAAVREN